MISRTLFCTVLFVMLSVLFQPIWAQRAGKSAFEEGEALRKQGKNEAAIAKYEEAISKESDNYVYYLHKGRCEFSLGHFDQAERSFQQTLRYRSDYAPAHAWLARLYKQKGNNTAAIDQYKLAARAEKNENSQFQYYLLLVNLLMDDGDDKSAKTYLDQAAAIKPKHYNVLYYQAEFAAREGNWEIARETYERALKMPELNKQSPTIQAKFYYGLGVSLNALGDPDGADAAFSKANFGPYKKLIEKRETGDEEANLYKIALSYYFNEAYDECNQYADKLLAKSPNFAGGYMLKARVALKRGRFEEAITFYQRAIKAEEDPTRRGKIQFMLADLYINQGRPEDALGVMAELSRSEARLATNPKALSLQARSLYEAGRYKEAINVLNALLATDLDMKTQAKYQFLLGMCAKKAGQKDMAKQAFQKASYGPYKPAAQQELKALGE